MSRTTPLGASPSVVRTIVISTRDTSVPDGMRLESTVAGFFLSSVGLVSLEIGAALILLPSGAYNVS